MVHDPKHNAVTSDYAINSDSITFRGKVNSHRHKEHVKFFSCGELKENPTKLYFDRTELLTCLLSNTMSLNAF